MIVGGGRNWIYAHIRIAIEQTDGSERSKAHKYPSTLNTHFSRVYSLCRRLQKKIGFLFRLGWVLTAGRRLEGEGVMTNGRATSIVSSNSIYISKLFHSFQHPPTLSVLSRKLKLIMGHEGDADEICYKLQCDAPCFPIYYHQAKHYAKLLLCHI